MRGPVVVFVLEGHAVGSLRGGARAGEDVCVGEGDCEEGADGEAEGCEADVLGARGVVAGEEGT